MLNAGLSTLIYLKSRILPEASRTDTTWDAALSALGKSIARSMESYCNRELARRVGAVHVCQARTLSISLRCYPVETISEIQILGADAITDYSLNKAAGLMSFRQTPASPLHEIRVTYTGGFWLDPLDDSTLPTGATALPEDILELWVSAVQAEAESRGLFEAVGLRAPKDAAKARPSGLSEAMEAGLRTYRRFSGE